MALREGVLERFDNRIIRVNLDIGVKHKNKQGNGAVESMNRRVIRIEDANVTMD